MQPKSTDTDSKNKKDTSNPIKKTFTKEATTIIQTTYEKVLSIINNVKDLIKKCTKNSDKIIEDLEWVIKVISNKSLYSYEVKRPHLSRQNSEYTRFVNFFNKYNDEVIEMNKKHVLVSGLLNLVKKGEILSKPSLCLKRILPDELQKMDYKIEKDKENRRKNIINLIGNAILNLYYKAIEKKKKENGGVEESQEYNEKKDVKEEKQKEKYKGQTDEREQMINIQKKKNNKQLVPNVEKRINNKLKNKLVNFNTTFLSIKRKTNSQNFTQLAKKDKLSLNSIKNAMENYYLKYALNDSQDIRSIHHFINKSNIIKRNKNNSSNKFYIYNENEPKKLKKFKHISFKDKNKNNETEDKKNKNKTIELKNNNINMIRIKIKRLGNKNNYINETFNNEDKERSYIIKNSKNVFGKKSITSEYKKNISTTLLSIENEKKFEIKKIKNIKILINKDNINYNKINTNRPKNTQLNNQNNKIISKDGKRLPLNSLISQYFEDLKEITDKDFDIFDFKIKVGYKNVLPLMCHCILKILGLLDNRIIVLSKLEAFLYSVSDNYKESTLYHNSLHGADVTQSLMLYFINTNAEEICEASVLDLLGIVISAMGHDLGHPGLTNNYHINASSDLAITYNDASCLENYHCSFLFKIIKKDETNIFEKLSVDNYKKIRKRMINQILATDMANHGEVISLIRTKIKTFQGQEEEGNKDEKDEKNKFILLSGNEKTKFNEQQALLNYLMHCADLGHNCKKYEISKKWVKVLCEEFWIQGDKEKSLGIPVSFLCDRDKIDVPSSQVGFLRGFIFSTFDSLVEIFPPLKFTMVNARNNLNTWQKLLEQKRVTGWTPKKEQKDKNENEK